MAFSRPGNSRNEPAPKRMDVGNEKVLITPRRYSAARDLAAPSHRCVQPPEIRASNLQQPINRHPDGSLGDLRDLGRSKWLQREGLLSTRDSSSLSLLGMTEERAAIEMGQTFSGTVVPEGIFTK
jgi:hypothetical protein